MLQVAQQALRAPRSLLPAGHPAVFPAASSGLATRMIPGLFELPHQTSPECFPPMRDNKALPPSTRNIPQEPEPGWQCHQSAQAHICHLQSKACRFHSSFTWCPPARDAIGPQISAVCPESSLTQPWQVPLAVGSTPSLPGFWRLQLSVFKLHFQSPCCF